MRRLFSTGFQRGKMSPLEAYRSLVSNGSVREDVRQLDALQVLDRVWHRHEGHVLSSSSSSPSSSSKSSSSWFSSLFKKSSENKTESKDDDLDNVYLYGTVGTGKSFLMDLFFDLSSDPLKKRVHFHAFMLDVHRKIHLWRLHERTHKDDDPIPPVAKKIRQECRLLCFDEFQVTDVADAMILKRLFEQMMLVEGMRMVMTSNREPEDLYKGGLNRPLFMPFVTHVLRQRFHVVNLSSGHDYRLVGEKGPRQVFLWPHTDPKKKADFAETFHQLTHGETPLLHVEIAVSAESTRKIRVPKSCRGVCWFTFAELLRANVGASDFLAIARTFHTVMLSDIPRLQVADNAVARRFITLVDALYEHRCKLICLSEGPPDTIFPSEAEAAGAAHEEVFAFKRTVSRLSEMQSKGYLQQAHRP